LTVRQSLANARLNSKDCAFPIGHGARVVPEIEFRDVAVQILFGAMLVIAPHSAFENAKEAFNRVRRHVATSVFVGRMLDRFMGRKFFAYCAVDIAFVSMQSAFAVNVLTNDLGDGRCVSGRDME
jgi:hypothetical protein